MKALLIHAAIGIVFGTACLAQDAAPAIEWTRYYRSQQGTVWYFRDVIRTADGGFAMCGDFRAAINHFPGWLLVTNEAGDVVIDLSIDAGQQSHTYCNSLIQSDDGGYVIGARCDAAEGSYVVSKVSAEGEMEWSTVCVSQQGTSPECFAVIELKNGSIMSCGRGSDHRAYAAMLSQEGEVIWERYYDGIWLTGMREVEEGIVFCNYRDQQTELLFIDFEGEPIRSYATGGGQPWSIVNTSDGGVATAGGASFNQGMWLVKGTREAVEWTRTQHIGVREDGYDAAYCLIQDGEGFLLVGHTREERDFCSASARFDRGGNLIWTKFYDVLSDSGLAKYYRSVISMPDGGVVIAGTGIHLDENGEQWTEGILVKYASDRQRPMIIDRTPELSDIICLIGDTLVFSVTATDAQGDELGYVWSRDGEEVGNDSIASVIFPEVGNVEVKCVVSDGALEDSTAWSVEVRTFYILDHQPDSLDLLLRRGAAVQFNLDVADAGEEPVEYLWTLTDSLRGEEEVFEDIENELSLSFDHIGRYSLHSSLRRGEEFDERRWNIDVRGLIWSFEPENLNLRAETGEALDFSLILDPPEGDTVTSLWKLDGDSIAGDIESQALQFETAGLHTVSAILLTSSGETDSIEWRITVEEPDWVRDIKGSVKSDLRISPNPFNQIALLKFQLEKPGIVLFSIHDISGREIWQETERFAAGKSSRIISADGFPAGVYFLKVSTENKVWSQKLVLLR